MAATVFDMVGVLCLEKKRLKIMRTADRASLSEKWMACAASVTEIHFATACKTRANTPVTTKYLPILPKVRTNVPIIKRKK